MTFYEVGIVLGWLLLMGLAIVGVVCLAIGLWLCRLGKIVGEVDLGDSSAVVTRTDVRPERGRWESHKAAADAFIREAGGTVGAK